MNLFPKVSLALAFAFTGLGGCGWSRLSRLRGARDFDVEHANPSARYVRRRARDSRAFACERARLTSASPPARARARARARATIFSTLFTTLILFFRFDFAFLRGLDKKMGIHI